MRFLLQYLHKNVDVLVFFFFLWFSFADFCHVAALKTFALSVIWLAVLLVCYLYFIFGAVFSELNLWLCTYQNMSMYESLA